jgi:hypothetical protein
MIADPSRSWSGLVPDEWVVPVVAIPIISLIKYSLD